MRQIIDFNGGWKFAFGDRGDYTKDFGYGVDGKIFAKSGEPAKPICIDFDDSAWKDITLPHDWTVGLKPQYSPNGNAQSHGYKPFGAEYPEYCIGWYRKKFKYTNDMNGKRVFFEFDGAYRCMQLWINGVYVAMNESGYIGDRYDITDMLYEEEENIAVARLDTSMAEGWFYEGCGIYRPVRLIITDNIHILDSETFVRSEVKGSEAEVSIDTVVRNDSDNEAKYTAKALIYDGETLVASDDITERVGEFKDEPSMFKLKIKNPKLWSTDEPNLYKVVIRISEGDYVIDEYTVNMGVRTIVFDADKGLFVNGKFTKVKGVCCHQDHAGVGSAISESLYEYRIKLLKRMGVNAYRCSHNPPSPALLDICDRLGMLVMDENRLLSSGPENLGQIERLIKRDRNHPSVFIWSMANEEGFIQDKHLAEKLAITIKRLMYKLDGTRLVTYAPNNGACETGVNSVCDTRGWNYINIGGEAAMDKAHVDFPKRPILGTEEASTVSTRGVWFENPEKGYVNDYGEEIPGWGSTPERWWSSFATRDYLLGSFVWTGFDYRGEPTPYTWPNVTSHFGIMDMCGFPKARYYYYKANWTDEDVIHILPDWNINVAEGTPVKVKIYTNCENITLYLNGKEVGKTDVEKYKSAYFTVNYEKGILKAVGTRNGKTVEEQIETADKAEVYEVTSESVTAAGEKTTVFTVTAKDAKGRFNAQCGDLLNFKVENGVILGVGNGDPSDHDCDLWKDKCRLFKGLLSVIVKSEPNEEPVLTVTK